jgi:pseudouridine synthase
VTQPPDESLRDASRGVRLQKALAEAGVGSRRHCETLIEQGEVEVNGRIVTDLPAWVDPGEDRIVVSGRRLQAPERHVYVMLHKPRRSVTTMDDPGGRRTVAEMVRHPSGARLAPVGRLDFDTSGLLLMTNDGALTNLLTHPKFGVEKVYRATLKGSLTTEAVARLGDGVYLADRRDGDTLGAARTAPVRLRIVSRDRDRTVLEVTLKEGRNRQVRRMFADVGFPVRRLMRTRLGPLRLKGLSVGEWRELSHTELGELRRAAGDARRRAGAPNRRAPKPGAKPKSGPKPGPKSKPKRAQRPEAS